MFRKVKDKYVKYVLEHSNDSFYFDVDNKKKVVVLKRYNLGTDAPFGAVSRTRDMIHKYSPELYDMLFYQEVPNKEYLEDILRKHSN